MTKEKPVQPSVIIKTEKKKKKMKPVMAYELGYTYVYQMTKMLISKMSKEEIILMYDSLTPEQAEILLFGLGISHVLHQDDPAFLYGVDDGLSVFILLLIMAKPLKNEFFGMDSDKNILHQVSLRNITRVICALVAFDTPLKEY